ncbi:MAG: SDR family oxidoreductase [Myxococcales bacterium]|nr:SDR family oxidoreductase [Myxococcales bacterium]
MALVQADLTSLHAVVTGANTGIGKVTALELARAGARVTLACRNQDKAQAAMDDIAAQVPGAKLALLRLDLGDLAQVRQAAAELLSRDEAPIDLLVNNAGLAGAHGTTAQGFEMHFGVNHMGPFVFTLLLLERVKAAPSPRIVNVASRAHYKAAGDPLDWDAQTQPTATRTGFPEYCVSKLCNVLFSAELDRRTEGVDIYSLHPGVIASDVWREVPWPFRGLMKMFMLTVEQGAMTTLHCASAADAAGKSGLYWDDSKPKKPSGKARDEALAAELWNRSLAWAEIEDATTTT